MGEKEIRGAVRLEEDRPQFLIRLFLTAVTGFNLVLAPPPPPPRDRGWGVTPRRGEPPPHFLIRLFLTAVTGFILVLPPAQRRGGKGGWGITLLGEELCGGQH